MTHLCLFQPAGPSRSVWKITRVWPMFFTWHVIRLCKYILQLHDQCIFPLNATRCVKKLIYDLSDQNQWRGKNCELWGKGSLKCYYGQCLLGAPVSITTSNYSVSEIVRPSLYFDKSSEIWPLPGLQWLPEVLLDRRRSSRIPVDNWSMSVLSKNHDAYNVHVLETVTCNIDWLRSLFFRLSSNRFQ